MPSESSEQRVSSKGNNQVGAPPPETEQLQCPRCDSNNTKFCYYNNYNFSQPRHFCKSCRRYWTHGGTLRDIPVGGGTRKNAKRSRTMHVTSTGSTTTTSLSYSSSSTYSSNYRDYCHVPGTGTATSAFLAPLAGGEYGGGPALPFMSDVKPVSSNFTSLLNTHGPGFFALGGIGLDDVGFGLGRAVSVWPFSEVQGGGSCVTGAGAVSVLGNAWQMQSGVEGGIGDCFTLSDVVTGNGMK